MPVAISMTQEVLMALWSSCNPTLWHLSCPSAGFPSLGTSCLPYPTLHPILSYIIVLPSQPVQSNADDHRHL